MCIGDMSLPKVGAVIPTARRAQLPERSVRSTTSSAVTSPATSPASVAAPGSSTGASRGSGSTSSTITRNALITNPGDGSIEGGDGEIIGGDLGERNRRNGLTGEDDELVGDGRDGGDERIADDEGDPTDETKDKIKEREEEEGPTTSPARIVSPLIRAVQGERQINRRGRNSLFIKQGTRAQLGQDRVITSSGLRPPKTFVSPFESGLIPLRR